MNKDSITQMFSHLVEVAARLELVIRREAGDNCLSGGEEMNALRIGGERKWRWALGKDLEKGQGGRQWGFSMCSLRIGVRKCLDGLILWKLDQYLYHGLYEIESVLLSFSAS